MEDVRVVVIGSGVAGLSVVSACAEALVISLPEPCSSTKAQGGIAVALDSHDSPELHAADTIAAGDGLCDERAVAVLVSEGKKRVQQLIEEGFDVDKNDNGSVALGREGAHSRARIVHAGGDQTGERLVSFLLNRYRPERKEGELLDLLVWKGRVYGAIVLQGKNVHAFFGHVVLATGGYSSLYAKTTNPPSSTGTGIAIAYTRGAAVQDMEFIQFHPTVCGDFLISEAMRGEGAKLYNEHHQRFVDELQPRSVVARAIFTQRRAFLDARHIDPARFPTIYKELLARGIDFTKDLIPVFPAAHYTIGGVKATMEGRTTRSGLFAVGECAATGVHGANRLASNSLLEGLVCGHLCGNALSRTPFRKELQVVQNAESLVEWWQKKIDEERETIDEERNKTIVNMLGEVLWRYAGIERSEETLRRAEEQLRTLLSRTTSERIKRYGTLASLIIRAARERKETRGCHVRVDYPARDETYRAHRVFSHHTA